ncbi:MAG: glycosyltransferase family 9 protein [Gemmatimonadaceae bacterium]|nr:glycosyltransferase family 9 protein [Gemmatimonadaceae bacterium]
MTSAPRRVLLIQLRRLGDVVLSTALLDDLHRAFPEAAVDMLVGAAAAPLLAGHPHLHERIVLDPDRSVAMWGEIRARRYDWVIDVQGSLRTALIARFSGARVRVGWRIRAWRLFYTHAHPRGGPREYVARERQRLLELVGVVPGTPCPRIYLSADERLRGERDARAAGASPHAARVGFLLSTREPAKDWDADRFGTVAAALARDGVTPIVFRTPGDEARVDQVRARTSRAIIMPPLDLRRFLGVLATCQVFVSGDTGPAHMADALGVPRVTVFGPTPPESWTPGLPTTIAVLGPGARVVRMRDRARLLAQGHDFTGDITPDMVLGPVRALLQGRTPRAPFPSSPIPTADD